MRRLDELVPGGLVLALSILAAACGGSETTAAPKSADDAKQFLTNVNKTMLKLGIEAAQAGWVAQNFITEDTEALNSETANELAMAYQKLAQEAKKFDNVTVAPDVRRQLTLLKISVVTQGVTAVAPPGNPKEAAELARTFVC